MTRNLLIENTQYGDRVATLNKNPVKGRVGGLVVLEKPDGGIHVGFTLVIGKSPDGDDSVISVERGTPVRRLNFIDTLQDLIKPR